MRAASRLSKGDCRGHSGRPCCTCDMMRCTMLRWHASTHTKAGRSIHELWSAQCFRASRAQFESGIFFTGRSQHYHCDCA